MAVILSGLPTTIISLIGTIFGILAFIGILIARKRLAGGTLQRYLSITAVALFFLVLASSWHLIATLTNIHHNFGEYTTLPHHILMIIAYFVLIIGSFQMLHISKELDFNEQASAIKTAISGSKKKKK